ncbi:MAG: CRISPR-associated protein Csm3 [Candidatus Atribacteria bacterium]|nr:CRISPR-associated protein Csm3 [Candidatus Atribacteria bacterium]
MNQFLGKLFLNGKIETQTGLHIGGSRETGEIGGMDDPVIKTADGIPYIPGSSLKGKMRCTLERAEGKEGARNSGEPCGCGQCLVCLLFGSHSSDDEKKTLSRLSVRDAWLDIDDFKEKFPDLIEEKTFTEEKTENIIDRISGAAKPRTIERVPAGSLFGFEMVLNFFEDDRDQIDQLIRFFMRGLRMVEDEYLGGSGTRGSGKVAFRNLTFSLKRKLEYVGNNSRLPLLTKENTTFDVDELIQVLMSQLVG